MAKKEAKMTSMKRAAEQESEKAKEKLKAIGKEVEDSRPSSTKKRTSIARPSAPEKS